VYSNLATEESLIECCQSGIFTPTVRLWINQPAAIVGRFQDVDLEVDEEFCIRNGVRIARRFTGGGAVYHDEGNLNLTILSEKHDIDLQVIGRRNLSVIQDTLLQFGIESTVNPPNSVFVDGKKISGASAAVRRNYVLWHASLLVSTSLESIARALYPSREPVLTDSVRSQWQSVTNLATLLGRPVAIQEVKKHVVDTIETFLGNELRGSKLTSCEEETAKRLHDEKYSTTKWNKKGLLTL